MKIFVNILNIVFAVILLWGNLYAEKNLIQFNRTQEAIEMAKVYSSIESGIANGDVSLISKFFTGQNYLSLRNGINGYYSANQSFYILQDFFTIYRPISFKFSATRGGNSSYATGTLVYESKGRRGSALVFISLESSGNTWKISQLTIK
jgi:hypothetical protein